MKTSGLRNYERITRRYLKITVTWNTELQIHIMYLPKLHVENNHSQSDRYFEIIIFPADVKHT